jgi:hypothetical protein
MEVRFFRSREKSVSRKGVIIKLRSVGEYPTKFWYVSHSQTLRHPENILSGYACACRMLYSSKRAFM